MTKQITKLKLHRETVQRLDIAVQPAGAAAVAASVPVRCFTVGQFTCEC